ncbi:hypothetical protein L1887_18344 [Cichorium endivia]|nr:hypothetical protein L1887_18344 [Cichorium endivia]
MLPPPLSRTTNLASTSTPQRFLTYSIKPNNVEDDGAGEMNNGGREREDEEEGDDGEDTEKLGHAVGDPSWYQVAVLREELARNHTLKKVLSSSSSSNFVMASFVLLLLLLN